MFAKMDEVLKGRDRGWAWAGTRRKAGLRRKAWARKEALQTMTFGDRYHSINITLYN